MSTIQEFDFSVDLLRAILWQYNDAENLQGLLEHKSAWYERAHSDFWSDWYRDVFDLRTANDFGLSVWSIILDQPLAVTVPAPPPETPAFGFGGFNKNFTNGNFVPLGLTTLHLDTEQSRLALRLRYYQLTTRGAVPEINRMMRALFGHLGASYVLDPLDMTMTYVFTFAPSAQLRLILQQFDLLPRPAGVDINYVVTPFVTFGFGEFHKNFTFGNFGQGL